MPLIDMLTTPCNLMCAHTHHIHQTFTGDTIVKSASSAKAAERSLLRDDSNIESKRSLALEHIEVPPPVFFCSVEPYSAAVQKGKGFITVQPHRMSLENINTIPKVVCMQ